MEKNEKLIDRAVNWMRYSISLKFIMIGVLTLLLLIPLEFIKELIRERKFRQEEMVQEVNNKWGSDVYIYGPVLKLPYKTFTEVQKSNAKTGEVYIEKESEIKHLYVFPESFDVNGKVSPFTKSRGIYKSVVFTEESKLSGEFKIAVKPSLYYKLRT